VYWRLQDCPSSARTPLLMRGRGYFISPVPLSHWRYTELSWSWLFWGACRQPEIWLTYFSDCDCQWHLAVFKQEFRRVCGCGSESLKADSHIACRAAKGLECFPIWFTQCGRVWFTLPMPCPCRAHAMLWPCRSTRGHGTARPSTACGLPARVRLLPATTRSSTKNVIRSIPILLTTIHTYECKVVGSGTLQKRRFVKPVFLNRRAAARYRALVSIIPGLERFSSNL